MEHRLDGRKSIELIELANEPFVALRPGHGLRLVLEELCARRRSLRLLILNRRVEAAKPVVDFQTWRDGNGAIHLCAAPLGGKRKASM